MAATMHSPLQNLKWLKIRFRCIKQPPAVVFGFFFKKHVDKVSHHKIPYDQGYVLNNEHICQRIF